MKFKSTILGQTSGSLAATVFSRNKAGSYTRNRTIPTNPNTPFQAAVRTAFQTASNAWAANLTADQRNGWMQYAQTNPVLDTLGNSITLSGLQMFCKVMTPIYLYSGAPPTSFDSPGNVTFLPSLQVSSTFVVDASAKTVDGTVEVGVNWVTGDALLLFITRPCSRGRTPVHEPQQCVRYINVTVPTPASDPFAFGPQDDPFGSVPGRLAGSPWMIRAYWMRGTNISSPMTFQGVTTA